jgi:hypothetical protein
MIPGTDLMNCETGFLSLHKPLGNTARYLTFPMRCNSWDCKICSKIKADKYKVRMRPLFDRPSLYMYTFTFFHNRAETEVWQNASQAWNRLRTAATKKYGRFSYVRILEHHHQSNYPHFHLLIDIRFSDVWLNAELVRAGFGYQAKVEKVHGDGAARYITKYLTKPWSSEPAKRLRKALHLRIICFGGDACLPSFHDSGWNRLEISLNCASALDSIHLDVQWRYGQSARITYEETHIASYELTIEIPEGGSHEHKGANLQEAS